MRLQPSFHLSPLRALESRGSRQNRLGRSEHSGILATGFKSYMKPSSLLTLPLMAIALVKAAVPLALIAAPAEKVDFLREVRPIFAEHCVKCHGPEKQKGGLRVDLKA